MVVRDSSATIIRFMWKIQVRGFESLLGSAPLRGEGITPENNVDEIGRPIPKVYMVVTRSPYLFGLLELRYRNNSTGNYF